MAKAARAADKPPRVSRKIVKPEPAPEAEMPEVPNPYPGGKRSTSNLLCGNVNTAHGRSLDYNDEKAKLIRNLSQYGLPQEQIARLVNLSVGTMLRLYREEYDKGAAVANAQVAQRLFKKALDGDTAALIFWVKARMQWRENSEVRIDLHAKTGIKALSDDELMAVVARGKELQSHAP